MYIKRSQKPTRWIEKLFIDCFYIPLLDLQSTHKIRVQFENQYNRDYIRQGFLCESFQVYETQHTESQNTGL